MDDSSRISPTAHYTSYVWFHNGMSDRGLVTPLGRFLYEALRPWNAAYALLSPRPNLEMMLLARHRFLDFLLEQAIASGEVAQVVEVAAGFSPRGFRFMRRFADRGLVYVEGDLPEQAAAKRAALERGGLLGPHHHVVPLDALSDSGEHGLHAIGDRLLDPDRPTVVVTEGLLGYFDRAAVEAMWARFASFLQRFPGGLYLSDLNIGGDLGGMRGERVFRVLLQLFARGRVHLHYHHQEEAVAALRQAGFAAASLHRPGDAPPAVEVPGRERRHVVRVIEARVTPA